MLAREESCVYTNALRKRQQTMWTKLKDLNLLNAVTRLTAINVFHSRCRVLTYLGLLLCNARERREP